MNLRLFIEAALGILFMLKTGRDSPDNTTYHCVFAKRGYKVDLVPYARIERREPSTHWLANMVVSDNLSWNTEVGENDTLLVFCDK